MCMIPVRTGVGDGTVVAMLLVVVGDGNGSSNGIGGIEDISCGLVMVKVLDSNCQLPTIFPHSFAALRSRFPSPKANCR